MEAACRFESSLKLLAQSSDPVAVVANYFYGKSAVTTKADFGARCVPPNFDDDCHDLIERVGWALDHLVKTVEMACVAVPLNDGHADSMCFLRFFMGSMLLCVEPRSVGVVALGKRHSGLYLAFSDPRSRLKLLERPCPMRHLPPCGLLAHVALTLAPVADRRATVKTTHPDGSNRDCALPESARLRGHGGEADASGARSSGHPAATTPAVRSARSPRAPSTTDSRVPSVLPFVRIAFSDQRAHPSGGAPGCHARVTPPPSWRSSRL
jgi:hypothetical protein